MRYFVIFSFVVLFFLPSFADTYLRDVPEGHWATEAVYDLVKRGVTSGYPDGTFHGKKYISREEMTAFLSKLARSFNRERGKTEKLLQELKAELALVKYESKEIPQLSGAIESRARMRSILPRGGKLDYRLKLNLLKNFDPNTALQVGLDSIDAGFNTETARGLCSSLIDIESNLKLGLLDFKINLGPGVIVHTEPDNLYPSENYTVYTRPKTSIKVSHAAGGLSLSADYVTRQAQSSGKIGVHELAGRMAYDFGKLALHFCPRYLFVIDGSRDMLAEVGADFKPNDVWGTNLLLAVGSPSNGLDGMYMKFIQSLKNPGGRGTNIVFRFDRAGSKYRQDNLDEYEFVCLNNFNRLILDGTVDLGFKTTQSLTGNLSFEWISDYVATDNYQYGAAYPGTYYLWQAAFLYSFSSTVVSQVFYRFYNVPSGTAQFSDSVPLVSDMLGIGLICGF